jgi:hypothetical protein
MHQTLVRYGMRALSVGAACAVMATGAAAQRYANAGGLGSALGGMLGVGLPGAGAPGGVTSTGRNDVGRALKTVVAQLNAGQLPSVPAAEQAQVGAVMGRSAPGNVAVLVNALVAGGVSMAAANSVAKGLTTLGTTNGSYTALIDAAQAYNGAVNSLAAGAPAPGVLLAVRAALAPLLEASK